MTRESFGSPAVVPHRMDLAGGVAGTVRVVLSLEAPDSLVAEVDDMRMRQVLDDMLDNAIIYSLRRAECGHAGRARAVTSS